MMKIITFQEEAPKAAGSTQDAFRDVRKCAWLRGHAAKLCTPG